MCKILPGCLLFAATCSFSADSNSSAVRVSDQVQIGDPKPLLQAHAHNDYEHVRPLWNALEQGFCSVEADVWLVEGQLLVAHDRTGLKPGRTLQTLYLSPLRDRIHQRGGWVYSNGPVCTLMIDVKSAAEPTYEALRAVLKDYADILTTFTPTNTATNALQVVLTGNRAMELVAAESVRYVTIDGRLNDLETNTPPNLMWLVSDDWKPHFQWRGEGPLPEDERLKLKQLVQRAHQQGRGIRFWGCPDAVTVWRELQSAGVDLIGTDDLPGLATFLKTQSP